MQIRGSVFLVTGGASGLGESTVRHLVALGARCGILDMNEQAGKALEQELTSSSVRFIRTDVSDEVSVKAAIARTLDAFGTLNGAVQCAGIATARKIVQKDGSAHPLDAFSTTIKVNLIGTFNVMRLASEVMARLPAVGPDGERGVFVHTASVAYADGQIGQCAYAASKSGVVGMTLPAARELAAHGIRVVTIAPGVFETPMLAGLPPKAQQSLAAGVPFPHRLGKSTEFAHLVQSIIENPYINGETIRLDGSLRMAAM
jgi:NAD(P)-dependent dehydrogenase (short-subunit alcohol dehydrogenase family)